jgi:ABC-type nitrate/sulfonate/bicarbonate transport system substrate-binding protein
MTTQRDKLLSRRALVKGASIAGASIALGGTIGARAQTKTLQKMSIFIGTTPHFGNVVIALEKGFLEKEGLPAQITNFASGATAVDAFRAGRGDVVVAGDLPSLRLWKQGGIGICPQSNYGDLSVIVSKKSINTPADLKGKKVGILIGSTSEYFAKLYLASGNIDYKDIDVINLRPAEMVTGLVRGDIQAFVIWQPFGWKAIEADKDAKILTTGRPYFHEWEMCSTNAQYAKDHPAELVAFLKGLDAAGKWIPKNVVEASEIIAKSLRMDDPNLAKQMIEKIDWNIAYTKKFRSDMDTLSHFISSSIDWSKMFDQQFLAKLGPTYVEA